MNQLLQNPPKLSVNQIRVLGVLASEYDSWEGRALYTRYIAKKSRLTYRLARLAVRALARKGLAKLWRGLMDDEGQVAGSGYAATFDGAMVIKACKTCHNQLSTMVTKQCEECWTVEAVKKEWVKLGKKGIPTDLLGRVSLCDLGIIERHYDEKGIPKKLTPEKVLTQLNKLVKPYGRSY